MNHLSVNLRGPLQETFLFKKVTFLKKKRKKKKEKRKKKKEKRRKRITIAENIFRRRLL
jgi:hypothetical protein